MIAIKGASSPETDDMTSVHMLQRPAAAPEPLSPPPAPGWGERVWSACARSRGQAGLIVAALWARKWSALAVSLVLALALYFGPALVLGQRVAATVPVRGLFVQTVVASGHVEAPFRVNVGSQITAVVASVPVVEGQRVKAGDTLIVLDDRELRAAMVEAEGAVDQAAARMRQMRELTLPAAQQSLKQNQATLLNAQQTYDRAIKLSKDGYTTQTTLDDAKRALDIATAQATSAQFQVSTLQPGGSDYAMAETQLSQAQASLTSAQARLSYTTIKAPRDGVLISRSVERGNTIVPGAVLMVLSPDGEIQLVVQIDEKNLGLIAAGQKALGSADAYAKETFPAEVFYVNPGIDLQRASVEVKLKVPKPPDYLRQDMTVSVDIEVARRENAVTLAVGSVHNIASSKPWVMKAVSGRARKQPVNVGIVSGGKAEIVAGLDAGDLVIPASNASIKDGQRIRARVPAPAETAP